MTKTQKLIDLCCCVNALDSYFCTDESGGFTKHSRRQRATLTKVVWEEANNLYSRGITLKQLNAAFLKSGWDDNRAIVGADGKIKIVYV